MQIFGTDDDTTRAQLASVARTLHRIADEIQSRVSFGVGRKNDAEDAPVDHPLFEDPAWDAVPARRREALRAKARQQLGTVGSGNHYPLCIRSGRSSW